MSTERFVSLPLITVNYIYNDLLLIVECVECVECVEWSCGVVDVEVVCRSQWCHRDSTFRSLSKCVLIVVIVDVVVPIAMTMYDMMI